MLTVIRNSWALLFGIMLLIAVCSPLVPQPPRQPASAAVAGDGFVQRLRQPGVPAFFVAVALMQLSHGPYYTFLSIHLEALGYSRGLIGMLWALGVLAEIVLFMFMHRLLAWISLRQLLVVSFALAALRWLLLGKLAEEMLVLVFAQLLHAATFGAFHVASIHLVQQRFGERYQGQGQALYATLAGIGGALGALCSGYAWAGMGPTLTFAAAALAAFVGMLLLLLRLGDQSTKGAG